MKRLIHPLGLLFCFLFSFVALLAMEAYLVPDDTDEVQVGLVADVEHVLEVQDVPQPRVHKNVTFRFLKPLHNHPLVAEFNLHGVVVEAVEEAKKILPDVQPPARKAKARIAIIIDDMGMNYPMTRAISQIDSVPLSLAFLPYAGNLERATGLARENGHELLIHMPMEAMDHKQPLGDISLRATMSRKDVAAMMERAFEAFDGYRGLNNHMGSRLTQDPEKMGWVMEALAARDLFYVDSKTINTSIAADAARDAGLRYAERDVFLDHEESAEFVSSALSRLERIAEKQGYAIAIGHPKKVTYEGLMAWLPEAQARGFEIVPVSELLYAPVEELAAIEVSAGDVEEQPAFVLND